MNLVDEAQLVGAPGQSTRSEAQEEVEIIAILETAEGLIVSLQRGRHLCSYDGGVTWWLAPQLSQVKAHVSRVKVGPCISDSDPANARPAGLAHYSVMSYTVV